MVKAVRQGMRQREAARQFGVSLSSVQEWLARAGDQRLDRVDFSDRKPGRTEPVNKTAKEQEDDMIRFGLSISRAGCLILALWGYPWLGNAASAEKPKSPLVKLPVTLGAAMENTPIVFGGQPLLALNYRDDTKNNTGAYKASMYLLLRDLCTGKDIARFGEGHSFVNAFVNGQELHVFASEGTDRDWFQSIYRFTSTDLKTWKPELAIAREGGEHLFNSSVCRDDQGFLMAYESNLPVQFCFKFARSRDLLKWDKIPKLVFAGVNGREYSACPVIRYVAPYYYVIYLHAAIPGHKGWVSFLSRSKDLMTWELSPMNPILEAGQGEGINNSDVDLFEWEGNTYLFYATGDQSTWGSLRVAMHVGSMRHFFESCFPAGTPGITISTNH